ncbi:hypothetical protein D557_2374 [Bordetella holmesii 70147]|nr:hypothetical protein D557_2374 [Bordetella holmesii 70147]
MQELPAHILGCGLRIGRKLPGTQTMSDKRPQRIARLRIEDIDPPVLSPALSNGGPDSSIRLCWSQTCSRPSPPISATRKGASAISGDGRSSRSPSCSAQLTTSSGAQARKAS